MTGNWTNILTIKVREKWANSSRRGSRVLTWMGVEEVPTWPQLNGAHSGRSQPLPHLPFLTFLQPKGTLV